MLIHIKKEERKGKREAKKIKIQERKGKGEREEGKREEEKEGGKELLENMQSDLRALSLECKKKFPPVKEVSFGRCRDKAR